MGGDDEMWGGRRGGVRGMSAKRVTRVREGHQREFDDDGAVGGGRRAERQDAAREERRR